MSYGDGGTYVVLADSLKQGLDALVQQGKQNPNQGQSGNNNGGTNSGTRCSVSGLR